MPDYAILALSQEHVRMLSVFLRVPRNENGEFDIRTWARMVDMPQRRVAALARGLSDMGAIGNDGTLPQAVSSYLDKLGRDCAG
jgi:hypothetical protein